jgi:hypothetical protein
MDFSDFVSLITSLKDVPPFVYNVITIVGSFAVMYFRTKRSKRHTQEAIERAIILKDIRDKADADESGKLKKRVGEILSVLKDRLYEPLENFVYDDDGEFRQIDIIRAKSKNPKNAKEFFIEHHSVTKDILEERVLPFFLEQLDLHGVAKNITQETKTSEDIAKEARGILLNGIHKECGSNRDTKAIEEDAVSLASMIDIYYEISKNCVLIRCKKEEYIESAIKAVQV